jgi:hypothetical protein
MEKKMETVQGPILGMLIAILGAFIVAGGFIVMRWENQNQSAFDKRSAEPVNSAAAIFLSGSTSSSTYQSRFNDVAAPVNVGNGNIQFPSGWTEEQCSIWRKEHNITGYGWYGSEQEEYKQ